MRAALLHLLTAAFGMALACSCIARAKGGVAALKSDAVIGSIEILHCAELAFIAYAALRSQTFPHWTRGPN
jgi:hypothetical protein